MTKEKELLSNCYLMGVEEAAEYYKIGKKKLYQLASDNPDADFFLMIGNRIHIKRQKFEQFLDGINVL